LYCETKQEFLTFSLLNVGFIQFLDLSRLEFKTDPTFLNVF